MSDLRRIVDEIRFYLDSNEAEMTESVREAASDYAEACHQANQRLRRCGEFLNRNLRSEAIQLSEAEPDLLEAVSTLDFAGRENWDSVVSLYNLPAVEPLLMEVAEALNEAYALQEPVKKLLDKHRFLALSRAPLKQRLAVLWKLVEQDPTIGSWETDASEMERARLREIEAETRDAVKHVDASGMSAIAEELEHGKWIEAISQQFKTAIAQSAREITRRDARTHVEIVAAALQTALAESALERARQLKTQWDDLQEAADLDGFDPVSLRAQPTLRWVAEEDAKESTRQKLEKAVASFRQLLGDERTPRDALERSRAALLRIDPAIPPPLEDRFRERVQRIERQEKFRRVSITGASVASVLVLAGLSGLLVRRSLQNAEASRLADALSQSVAEGKLVQARGFANEHVDLAGEAHWETAVKNLTDAEDQEKLRAADFSGQLASAAKAGDYAEARAKLDKAVRLARTEDEKSQAERLSGQVEEQHRKDVTTKTSELQQRFDAITADLHRAQTMHNVSAPAADIAALLSQIGERLTALRQAASGSEGDHGSRIGVLETELKSIKDLVHADSQKVAALDAIKHASLIHAAEADSGKQVSDYIAALAAFTQAFPDDPRTPDFQEVRNEAALYAGICAWQNMAAQWKTLNPGDLNDARKRAGECAEFLKQHAQSPAAPLVQQYAAFAEAVQRRESDGLVTKLHDLFAGPLMHDVHVLRDNESNAYYLKNAVDLSGKRFANVKYLSGFGGEEKNKTLPTEFLKKAVSEPAPQSPLSDKALVELAQLSVENWEPSIGHLAHFVLDAPPSLDPFLRYALLRYVLEYGAAGSDLLNPGLQQPLGVLHNGLDLSTPWMLPDSAAAKKARPEAEQVVFRIIDLDKAWTQADRRREQLSQAFFCPCLFIGRLSRNAEGQWGCVTRWTADGNYDLVVAVPGANGEPSRWEPIGTVKDGKVTIARQERATVLREGRLILARPPEAPK